jgi:uncharacterized membrane protein YqhA
METASSNSRSQNALGGFIFASRWLQAPLYFGLIVAQAIYVYRFMVELWHLVMAGADPPDVRGLGTGHGVY